VINQTISLTTLNAQRAIAIACINYTKFPNFFCGSVREKDRHSRARTATLDTRTRASRIEHPRKENQQFPIEQHRQGVYTDKRMVLKREEVTKREAESGNRRSSPGLRWGNPIEDNVVQFPAADESRWKSFGAVKAPLNKEIQPNGILSPVASLLITFTRLAN